MATGRALGSLIDVERADVYRAGRHLATLTRHRSHVEFRYLPEAIGGDAVASTLPAVAEPVMTPGRAVPPFFAGLLPEGRRLTALRTAIKTSADDDFSMLLAVGEDMVGDVQVVPAGETPRSLAPPDRGDGFAQLSFGELFAAATGRFPDQVGLAGVQDKVSGRMISVPVAFGGAAYLLKLDPPEFPHLVANEDFFLRLAADCGLSTVAASVVHDRDRRPGLLVTRFDRSSRGDAVIAHAVEDGCQVLGRYPADKYAVGYLDVFAGLAARCPARPVALRALLQQLVVAIVTGNGDFHAKNASIVQVDGEWRVAPAYDLPSSYPYGDTTLALPIAGSREAQVSRKRLVAFAVQAGLPERAAILTIDDVLDRVEPWVGRLDELPFDGRRIADLRRLMTSRIRLLRG
jgi:serine/threonine-protein kinase HipA